LPELPEVEVVCRGLDALVTGRRVARIDCLSPRLRYPLPPEMAERLQGSVCEQVQRRAKYLLFGFGETLLVWHLGMTGQFHVLPGDVAAGRHEHVRIDFDDGGTLRYRDARRFGYAGILPAVGWQAHPWFAGLGPEPLQEGFDVDYLHSRCVGRRTPIKHLLMDARMVVGVGNIYASEALHRAGIHPTRAAGRIAPARLDRLVGAVRQVLSEAIAAGGSSISDFVRVDGHPGYFAHAFEVYGRAGQPCGRCGGRIRRIVQIGRSSFYCPQCQH
jgi:formamidopyrimidine-DNA glycosylase